MMNRPDWDRVWMGVAELVALRSYDPNHRVGAIVVTSDNARILALGYNGNYEGGPNRRESDEPGKSGFIHAEINALLKLDYHNPYYKKMYVTLSPCAMCAKAIVNAGIDEVIYGERYEHDIRGLRILANTIIKTRRYEL